MSVSLTVNGTSYTFPTTSDEDWGTNVTNWASSVSSNTLQKNGGNFTLTADVNFGSNYGLLSSYFSSRADAADAGLVRLSNTDYIAFRNSADDGNLILGLSGDTLQFNSVDVADVSSSQSLSNKTIVDPVLNGSVSGTAVLDEDDMSSDSATALATQQSIKAYVDSQISSNNDASEISYDNSTSGLTATDVNAAIDELEDEIDADVANLSSHTANTSNPHSVTASQLGLGNVDNTSDATKNSASATLENKTLDAPVIDNSLVLTEESSSPSAPSSGYKKLYAKNDGKVYTLDSSSNEIEVGSGSGGGEENFIDSYDSTFADGSTGNWETYKDSSDYEDGTGGTSSLTISATSSSAEVLKGSYSLKIAKPASNVEDEGVSLGSISIPRAYRNKTIYASMLVDFTEATGEHWEVRAYDETNSAVLYVGGEEARAISAKNGKVVIPIHLENDAASIRLSLHCKSSSADAYDLFATDFKVSSIQTVISESTSDWENFTDFTIGAWSAGVSTSGKIKRNGDNADIQISMEVNGAVSGIPYITLNDLTVDSTKLSATSNSAFAAGYATILDATTTVWVGVVNYSPSNGRFYIYTGRTSGQDNVIDSTSPFTFGGTDIVTVRLSVPIVEWANSRQVMNEFELTQQTNKAKMSLGSVQSHSSSGSWVAIDLDTSEFDVGGLVDVSNNKITVKKSGYYTLTGSIGFATNSTGNRGTRVYVNGSEVMATIHDASNSSVSHVVRVTDTVYINAGEDVELYGFQDTGGSLSINTSSVQTSLSVVEQPDYTTYGVVQKESIAPTITRLTSGSGTYTVPTGVRYLTVEMVGGGAGGGGGGTSATMGTGGDGGDTTFGSSLLIAEGGNGGREGSISTTGGAVTVNSPAVNIAAVVGDFGGGFDMPPGGGTGATKGGRGGSSPFGGAGGGAADRDGVTASHNSGSGGAGGGTNFSSANARAGGGGGAGGYIKAMISGSDLESSYSYSVGAGGSSGSAGTNGYIGGAGGSGIIIITEHYY